MNLVLAIGFLLSSSTFRSRSSLAMSNRLLEEWWSHDSIDFHRVSDPDEIRRRLLSWYREHRRKLPWRGDAPPWNGSTSHFAESTSSKKKPQTSLKDFFVVHDGNESAGEAFPVTAYGIWVSEIMLQQTRVEAVIPYWVKWMKRFPTVHDLAAASDEDVNAHWAGLGFYRRARLLHQAAKYVVDKLGGELPTTVEGLLELPGIGRYTASAIASIAYGVPVPVVDGNVCRVLSRLSGIANHVKAPVLKDKYGWDLAARIVTEDAGEVNQALMELGATYCAPSGTGVDPGDPLEGFYLSTDLGSEIYRAREKGTLSGLLERSSGTGCPICSDEGVGQALNDILSSLDDGIAPEHCGHRALPLEPPKLAKRDEVLAVAALSFNESWLMVKRPPEGLLAGQWEFPNVCVWKSEKQNKGGEVPNIVPKERREALNEYLLELGDLDTKRKEVGDVPVEHIFSHVRHIMWIEHSSLSDVDLDREWTTADGRPARWMTEADMRLVGITSGVKKVLKAVERARSTKASNKKARLTK